MENGFIMQEKKEFSHNPSEIKNSGNELILFNDDINTFDHVIDSLIEVCKHTAEQAEQCAITAHLKGKCGIKQGEFTELILIHNELKGRGLLTEVS